MFPLGFDQIDNEDSGTVLVCLNVFHCKNNPIVVPPYVLAEDKKFPFIYPSYGWGIQN